ncbi:MAG TPA: hypothetical protein PK711_02505 [Bacteroidales bacterium]|nr:hypothetical protein [Bacteroidales bacterium]
MTESYCEQRLSELGIAPEHNQIPLEYDSERQIIYGYSPQQATFFQSDRKNNIRINYVTLDGNLVDYEYQGKIHDYYRTRVHPDNVKGDAKYISPKGSKSCFFYPPGIIHSYLEGIPINTLGVVEGEFKAFKACMHNVPFAGIQGIHNFKDRETMDLPEDFKSLIKKCQVRNLIFLMDADCISEKYIRNNFQKKDLFVRLNSFYTSVRSFRELCKEFEIDLYLAHIKTEFEETAKGVDDLLVLKKDHEQDVRDDLFALTKARDFFEVMNISDYSLPKIKSHFLLNEDKKGRPVLFYDRFKDILKEGPFTFKFRKWQYKEGDLVNLDSNTISITTSPGGDFVFRKDLQFWQEKSTKSGDNYLIDYKFDYYNAYQFFTANNFYRFRKIGKEKDKDYVFVRIENKVLTEVLPYMMRDFLVSFVKTLNKKDLLNMIFKGAGQYLNEPSLSNIDMIDLNIVRSGPDFQYMFFNNSVWKVSSNEIVQIPYDSFEGYIWRENVINFSPTLVEPLFNVDFESGKFHLSINDDHDSHFLRFLLNTSRMYHKVENSMLTNEMKYEEVVHFLNKISAIGYLLHNFRNDSRTWAVVAMDNSISEVGESNGGTGKSLLGFAFDEVCKSIYIEGKSKKLTDNPHIWALVNERSDMIFIDDVRMDVDFEFFYTVITGKVTVNQKNIQAFILPKEKTPKIYLSTNHALHGNGESDERRQFKIAFSDYYHKKFSPADEFNVNLFSSKWGAGQWNLFYNVMARSVQFYMKHGKVEAPGLNLIKRRLRQEMGEPFLDWAEKFFSDDRNLNVEIPKGEVFDNYKEDVKSIHLTSISAQRFKKKLKAFCQFKGYYFNQSFNGERIIKNGMEYIEVSKKETVKEPEELIPTEEVPF